MNFQNLLLPVNVSMTITPEFKRFEGIPTLVRSCKQATNNVNFPINLKAKILLQMFSPNTNSNTMIFTQPQRLDCIILNQRYLNIQFTLLMTETGKGTTQEIKHSLIFLCADNSKIWFLPHSVSQFSIKCEIEILPERAEGAHIYPCTYQKMTVPEKDLEHFDQQSGWKTAAPLYQQAQQQAVQQNRRMQVAPNFLQGEQQTIARRKVAQQLCTPTNDLIIGSDGSFFVCSRITNTILFEGTFSVYQPGTIEKYPNTIRCVLSSRPIISQPVYQPVYQPTNQPIQRAVNVFENQQPSQMIQFGLPPNVHMGQQTPQQQQRTYTGTDNVVHIQHPQPNRMQPAGESMNPMEEEASTKSPHEDTEKDMSTGKHYQPISIDLSADDDDERTVTAETSETEELPSGM